MKTRRIAPPMLLLLLLAPLPVHAAGQDNDEFQRHYERGMQRFDKGDYDEAIRQFQQAFSIRQFPRLLLHLGRAHRKLGHAKEALGYLQAYLRVEPDPTPESKLELERYIAATKPLVDIAEDERRKLNAAEPQAPQAPAPGTVLPPPQPPPLVTSPPPLGAHAAPTSGVYPLHKKWWFWTAVGGAVATAVVVGAVAGRPHDSCPPSTCYALRF